MEKYEELVVLIGALRSDAEKFFEKGNAAAGTRVRKGLQCVKSLAQELRGIIQDAKNSD